MQFFTTLTETMNEEHEGAVAFEYVIILIIMAVALFISFTMLQKQLVSKADDISNFIAHNGQQTLGQTVGK